MRGEVGAARVGSFGQHQSHVHAAQGGRLQRLRQAFGGEEVGRLDVEVPLGVGDAEDEGLQQHAPPTRGAAGEDLH